MGLFGALRAVRGGQPATGAPPSNNKFARALEGPEAVTVSRAVRGFKPHLSEGPNTTSRA